MFQIPAVNAAIKLRSVGYTVTVYPDRLACDDNVIFFNLTITDGTVSEDRFNFYYRLGAIFN